MGVLSDTEMRYRLGLTVPDTMPRDHPNRLEVNPFSEFTKIDGHPSYGIGSYGIDLRLGTRYKYLDKHELARRGIPYVRPGTKNLPWVTCELSDAQPLMIVPARSAVLAEVAEYIRVPRDCYGQIFTKSTWARLFIDLNTTPAEPEWCMSEDTEILTESGWRLLADVGRGDRVLTRRADGIAEYQPVLAKQAHEYEGDLIHFAGRSVDQLVTPEHELFVRYRLSSGLTDGRKVRAEDVYKRHNYCFDRQVNWAGPEPERIEVAGRSWAAADFLEFYGSWIGDGSAYLGGDGGYHVKLAVVNKEEKRKCFQAVLDRMGVKYRLFDRGFHFFDRDLCLWLRNHGHAHDKYIRREFLQYGPGLLSHLLRGLMQSDGCALTETYTTVSKRLADDFQELAFKCGQSCIVRSEVTKRFGVYCQRYIMRLSREQLMPKVSPRNHRLVTYRGMVYDVTVPNHVFLSRRNGKASWTGNCGVLTLEVTNNSEVDVAIERGEGIAQIVFYTANRPDLFPLAVSYADRDNPTYQNQTGVREATA